MGNNNTEFSLLKAVRNHINHVALHVSEVNDVNRILINIAMWMRYVANSLITKFVYSDEFTLFCDLFLTATAVLLNSVLISMENNLMNDASQNNQLLLIEHFLALFLSCLLLSFSIIALHLFSLFSISLSISCKKEKLLLLIRYISMLNFNKQLSL